MCLRGLLGSCCLVCCFAVFGLVMVFSCLMFDLLGVLHLLVCLIVRIVGGWLLFVCFGLVVYCCYFADA